MSTANKAFLTRWYAPWLVCMTAALFFFYEFVEMNMFNTLSGELTRSFHIDLEQLGYLSAFYFYADVLFLFPAGMILDRIPTRRVILFAMTLCITGTIIFACANSFYTAAIGRFLTGIGNAFCFLSCVRLASRWFDSRHMALVLGIVVTIAMCGGAFAQTPLAILIQYFGWRGALLVTAALGVVIALLVFFVVYDYPPNAEREHQQELDDLHKMGVWQSVRLAVSNLQNWYAGVYTSLLNLSIFILGGFVGALYLKEVYHYSAETAGWISMMVFVGTIIGAPVIGYISDQMGSRRLPMIIGALLSVLTMLLIMFPLATNALYFAGTFFLLGLFTSSQVLTYPLVAESNLRAVTSTAVGLSSVLIMSGGAIFQPLCGWLLQYHWVHVYHQQVPFYSLANFITALWILPISFGVALLASILIRDTNLSA